MGINAITLRASVPAERRQLWTPLDSLVNHFQDLPALFANERQARGAHPFVAKAALLNGELDVLNELGVNIQMQQRREPLINLARTVPFAIARQFPEILVLGGKGDAAAGDPAIDSEHGAFQNQ